MKNLLYATLCLATIASSGCKKDAAETVPATSAKAALLVGKRWNLTALTSQQGSVIRDGYASLKACEKDNYLRFNEDRTAEMNESIVKCNTSDPQSYAGNWDLVANESKLFLTTPLYGSGAAGTPDILELSANRMVLRALVIDGGVSTTYTATLTPL